MDFFLIYILDQRPWSEWVRTDVSCIQYTGHDIEQVQQLFRMCKQSLLKYCLDRKQHTNERNVTYLSPINLLVVTLWYLKHYHTERYIVTELDSTVNYFFIWCDRYIICICISETDFITG